MPELYNLAIFGDHDKVSNALDLAPLWDKLIGNKAQHRLTRDCGPKGREYILEIAPDAF